MLRVRKLQESILLHMDVDAVKKNGELAAGPPCLLYGIGLFRLGLSTAFWAGGDLRKKEEPMASLGLPRGVQTSACPGSL